MSAKDIAEFDATGMLNMYPRCVLEGYHAFTAHLRMHQQSFVGITLFVSTQGCGRPQEADEQKVDTHVFCCVVNPKNNIKPELGYNKAIKVYGLYDTGQSAFSN